jgi:hypothetical protein
MKNAIIYGAGKIGALLYDALAKSETFVVKEVWDKSPEKCLLFPEKNLIKRVDVSNDSDMAQGISLDDHIFICIYSPALAKDVAENLRSKGFENIISDRSEISELLSSSCVNAYEKYATKPAISQCFKCPARRDERKPCTFFNKLYDGNISIQQDENQNPLIYDTLGMLITTKCNLTCVGCNHLRDHFEKENNIDFNSEEIIGDIARIVEAVDFIKSLVIVGGEALVHPEFTSIIQNILQLKKIGYIQIITNGSFMPKLESVFSVLKSNRIVVEVSGYGSVVGENNIKRREKFIQKLADYGINYSYDETASWTDFGGFENRNHDIEKIKNLYNECCFVSNDLMNGRLHKCSRSAYGQFIGKTPHYERDFVDVRAGDSIHELRKRLRLFQKLIPSACKHCDGTSTKTIPAGVQVVKINEIPIFPL